MSVEPFPQSARSEASTPFRKVMAVGLSAAALAVPNTLKPSPSEAQEAGSELAESHGLTIAAFVFCVEGEAVVGAQAHNGSEQPIHLQMDMPFQVNPWEDVLEPNHVAQHNGFSGSETTPDGQGQYSARYHDGQSEIRPLPYEGGSCEGGITGQPQPLDPSTPEPTPTEPGTGGPERPVEYVSTIAGPSRVETAVAISAASFTEASTAVIATGDNFPDALAGGPLAHAVGGPLLLTGRDALHPATAEELVRLDTDNVILLGGEAVLTPYIEEQLAALGIETTRLAGNDRFETAVAIADYMDSLTETAATTPVPESETVVLANGHNFPDALAAGTLAAHEGAPILLSRPDSMPTSTGNYLIEQTGQVSDVIVVGGNLAVSEAVEAQANQLASAESIRLAGDSRIETALEIAEYDLDRQGVDLSRVYLATASNYPDALAASPMVASVTGGALILIDGTNTSEAVHRPVNYFYQDRKTGEFNYLTRIGSDNAISDEVFTLHALMASSHSDGPARGESASRKYEHTTP